MVYGVWCMVNVLCLVYDVGCMVYGVWCICMVPPTKQPVVEGAERCFSTFKTSREAQTLVAGEGGACSLPEVGGGVPRRRVTHPLSLGETFSRPFLRSFAPVTAGAAISQQTGHRPCEGAQRCQAFSFAPQCQTPLYLLTSSALHVILQKSTSTQIP